MIKRNDVIKSRKTNVNSEVKEKRQSKTNTALSLIRSHHGQSQHFPLKANMSASVTQSYRVQDGVHADRFEFGSFPLRVFYFLISALQNCMRAF